MAPFCHLVLKADTSFTIKCYIQSTATRYLESFNSLLHTNIQFLVMSILVESREFYFMARITGTGLFSPLSHIHVRTKKPQ